MHWYILEYSNFFLSALRRLTSQATLIRCLILAELVVLKTTWSRSTSACQVITAPLFRRSNNDFVFFFCSQTLVASSNHQFIAASHFKPAATYCAKVRSIYSDTHMTTNWSEWSPMTCWETGGREVKESVKSAAQLPSLTLNTVDAV